MTTETLQKIPVWNGKVQPDHHISYAFTCGTTHNFYFTDLFNIPSGRAHDALHIYDQYKIKCDEPFLRETCMAMDNEFMKKSISIFELKKLKDQIFERLDMVIPPPRLAADLASVYYFDESENPYAFDRAYGEIKIKKWRSEKITIIDADGYVDAHDFFLSPPIRSLMPCSELPEQDFQTYLQIAEKIDEQHLKTIFNSLSLIQQKTSSYKKHYLKSDTEEMKD